MERWTEAETEPQTQTQTEPQPQTATKRHANVDPLSRPDDLSGQPRPAMQRVTHPILRLEVLAADGTQATDHVVFCRLQRQSVRVEDCCRCVHCDAITETPEPAVECTIALGYGAIDDPDSGADPDADPDADVGRLLCHGTVVVSDSFPLGPALSLLRDANRRSVAIVDARHVMIGLVRDTASTGGRRSILEGAVTAAMTTATMVDERTPVRTALRLLAAKHLREATVVSKRGVPIGTFRDVDGLRWVAAARQSVPREE